MGLSELANGFVDSGTINRASTGDQEAWLKIFNAFNRRLLAYCYACCFGRVEPSDVVQETWLEAYRRSPQIHGMKVEHFLHWLMRIAATKSVDAYRKVKRQSDITVEELESTMIRNESQRNSRTTPLNMDEKQALEDCLQKIGQEFQDAMRLRLDGRSYEEIGDILGLPSGTVSSKISRGTVAVKQCVEGKLS